MTSASTAFSDPQAVARYTEGPPRIVPGYTGMQRMAGLLLAERIGPTGRVLVLGAGGGLELKSFADAHPHWTFDGVDPSAEMLALAEQVAAPHMARIRLHRGTIDDAPEGPFDGATCLLTMHFLDVEERRRTAAEVRRRLKPGAPFVVAHFSIPGSEAQRALWLQRYSAFATASGVDAEKAEAARAAIAQQLTILSPDEDEAILRDADFTDIELFYAGFTFRGWVGSA
ncbi:class I SAM-dependent methyltransferase [Hyphomicrobium sulfonivorans]|uniref:class I SAM-dependent methyltransferase n=1 Tax=Hyphomicrobium sulfonivorans TaxID=121290 RepID=UPI0015713811|nr:class I SAM-dependent methyltransferase [Hyphomicrobium sulfonivorans]MBI1649444.1 class I SAM-dependent methyltransferase [Hyphomicrobium sulfonivorans]NSL71361.1 methyltransferase [Hyphomicrobium sulfonivorans]